jgi:type IV pilus assembly protein PilQ
MDRRGDKRLAIALAIAILCAPALAAQEPSKQYGPAPALRRLTPRPETASKDPARKPPQAKSAATSSRRTQNSAKPASNHSRDQTASEKQFIRKTAAQEPAQEGPAPKEQDTPSKNLQRTPREKSDEPPPNPEDEGPILLPAPNRKDDQRLLQFDNQRPPTFSVNMDGELITLTARAAALTDVLEAIAEQHGLNLVAGDEVAGSVTVNLKKVSLQDALRAVLLVNGYTWHQDGDILIVSDLSAESRTPDAQRGALVRVFQFNYIAADDVDKVVQGLLSPVGKTFITASQTTDKRKTREELVVQDLPAYLDRIEQYIAQVDRPPRQVLIEAHILQVDLRDELRHGVNLTALARVAGADVTLRTVGLANPLASPAMFFGIDGTDLDALIEAMRTLTDAKTLASPKVLVVNGQEAKLQVGGQLGYFMTTTTQTSSMQSVQFLDVGVVLTVTPVISDDGHVLMTVKPEVSKGRINPQTNLPEKDTTQTQTTLMLQSGQGMVIGGLIQETDTETMNKVPLLGDVPIAGWLFRRRVTEQRRQELIIAVVPRIVPLMGCAGEREQVELDRALSPLVSGPVCTVDRSRWEPIIPTMRTARPVKTLECEEGECNPVIGPQNCDRDQPADYVPAPIIEEVSRPTQSVPSSRIASASPRPASKPPVVQSRDRAAASNLNAPKRPASSVKR